MTHSKNKNLIETAIKHFQQLHFIYDHHPRTANPHHLGMLGNELQIHAYQVSDGSSSDHIPAWKNFKIADIKKLKILPTTFIPEQTYHPENSHYSAIYTQIRLKNKG